MMNTVKMQILIYLSCAFLIIGHPVVAQQIVESEETETFQTSLNFNLLAVLETALYSIMGIALFFTSYKIYDLLTPFSLPEELAGNQNVAVAITLGAIFIGLAIIIAASIPSSP